MMAPSIASAAVMINRLVIARSSAIALKRGKDGTVPSMGPLFRTIREVLVGDALPQLALERAVPVFLLPPFGLAVLFPQKLRRLPYRQLESRIAPGVVRRRFSHSKAPDRRLKLNAGRLCFVSAGEQKSGARRGSGQCGPVGRSCVVPQGPPSMLTAIGCLSPSKLRAS